ncbi:unnamed protein product, partial [Phaeothamnion confervicola]
NKVSSLFQKLYPFRSILEAQALVNAGASVKCRDCKGKTPLHWACERGHVAVAGWLLGNGADHAARDDDSRTPAEYIDNTVRTAFPGQAA